MLSSCCSDGTAACGIQGIRLHEIQGALASRSRTVLVVCSPSNPGQFSSDTGGHDTDTVRDREAPTLKRPSPTPASRPTPPSSAKRRTKASMSPRIIQDLPHFRGWRDEESSKSGAPSKGPNDRRVCVPPGQATRGARKSTSNVRREPSVEARRSEAAGRNVGELCRVERTTREGPSGPSPALLGEGSSPGRGFWSSPEPLRRKGGGMQRRSFGQLGRPYRTRPRSR